MPEEPDALDDEQCPDLDEANRIGDALWHLLAGVSVCHGCAAVLHRDWHRCPECGRTKPHPQ